MYQGTLLGDRRKDEEDSISTLSGAHRKVGEANT